MKRNEFQQLILLSPNGESPPGRWRISGNEFVVEIAGASYSASLKDGFRHAVEQVVERASRDHESSLRLLHCSECVHFGSSGMAKQMSNGFVGNCSLYDSGVHALYWCASLLTSDRFEHDWTSFRRGDAGKIRRKATSALGASREINVYQCGTVTVGRIASDSTRSHTRLISIAKTPRKMGLKRLDECTLVDFGNDAVYSVIMDDEVTEDAIESANKCSLLEDHDVSLTLGLVNLTLPERCVALIALSRLQLDAATLIVLDRADKE